MAKKTTQTTPELGELLENQGERAKKNCKKNYTERAKNGQNGVVFRVCYNNSNNKVLQENWCSLV